jgi:hypothetical protein
LMIATVSTVLPLAATVSQAAPGYWYKGTNNFIPPEQPVPLPPVVGAVVAGDEVALEVVDLPVVVEGAVVGLAGAEVGLAVADLPDVEGAEVGLAVDDLPVEVGLEVAGAEVGLVGVPLEGKGEAAFVAAAVVGAAAVGPAAVGPAAVGVTGALPEYDTPVLIVPTETELIALLMVTVSPFTEVRRTETG